MGATDQDDLPFIDRLHVDVDAPPEQVWNALVTLPGRAFASLPGRAFARALRTDPAVADGRAPDVGGTIPGFRVTSARAPEEWILAGRHRFARYQLTFRIHPHAGRTRLEAETRATFLGIRGRAYRALVIGGRLHLLAVRQMLRRIQRAAQRRAM